MTCLFDTNAWLRLAENPESVSARVRWQLEQASTAYSLSVISIWEVGVKVRKGKLSLSLPLDDWLHRMLDPSYVRLLPIDQAVARLANNLPGDFHDDPADRFIVATALIHGLTVVTSDRLMIDCPFVPTLDTR
jgi:PIN domain nuclease of toxin-antitoxin system